MNILSYIAQMMAGLRGQKLSELIQTPPARHPKPHREHMENKISKQERKKRQRIHHLSCNKRRKK